MKTIILAACMACLVFVILLLPSLASKSNSQQSAFQSEVEEEPQPVFSDLAAIYYYGNDEIRIHVWLSAGNEFKYEGSRGYWSTTGYPANSIVHVLAGEFGK